MNTSIIKSTILFALVLCSCMACGNKMSKQQGTQEEPKQIKAPVFNADSAYKFVADQCNFGPRVPNTEAHRRCGDYLVAKFKSYGATVVEQKVDLTAYDGKTVLKARNIIASINPMAAKRLLVCAHWDCRPWADNDPDSANWRKPVMGANDAASGVAVMLEMARLIQTQPLNIGVDFICFDAEDYGLPQWENYYMDSSSSWCLGSQYWAAHPHVYDYRPRFGILLDMVGGMGCTFSKESYSMRFAPQVVDLIWKTAAKLGYSQFFPPREGGYITDDHVPVNEIARIPCVNIVPYFTEGPSSFGPTWHTVYDDIEHIDPNVLKAVGQTVIQVIYNENQ